METIRFSTREEAKKHLEDRNFEFMGAPNRWRKFEDGKTIYAKIWVNYYGAAVIISDGQNIRETNGFSPN
jgi:hypothetical protein